MDAQERENCRDEREVGSDDIDVPDDRHLQKDNHQSEKTGPKTKEIIKSDSVASIETEGMLGN